INSHFYAASPAECAEVLRRFSSTWIQESADVFAVPLPDVVTGRCPAATFPVYRLFNDRSDVNHRYTPDPAIRDSMIGRGYRSEGYGAGGVAFCALGASVTTGVAAALRVPAWRAPLSRGHMVSIAGTANMNGVTLQGNGDVMGHRTIDAWNGLAAGGTAWWAAANGGHDQGNGTLWENKVYTIDLAADVPRWRLAHPGSPRSMVTPNGDHYLDGLPVSRHTYYSAQYLESIGRVMLVGAAAPYAIGFPAPAFQGGPIMDGFDVSTGRWDPAATWAEAPANAFWVAASIARDPRSDDLYLAARHNFAKWTRSSNAWTRIVPRNADGSVVANPAAWQYGSSLIDVRRSR
ncbi:MAG TPA: hypothetical protein VFV33_03570, partial [Gemmatimonadaceae bacterium]|nr:hypothetical protein [Gemmatimonadaceae bacterium]